MTVASGALAAVVASVGMWAVVEIRGTGDERIGQLLISWLALWLLFELLLTWLAQRRRQWERRTLVRYFRARHTRGERLHVLRLRYLGRSGGQGRFRMVVRRSAGDMRTGIYVITGKTVCDGGPPRITSWLMKPAQRARA